MNDRLLDEYTSHFISYLLSGLLIVRKQNIYFSSFLIQQKSLLLSTPKNVTLECFRFPELSRMQCAIPARIILHITCNL